MKPLSEVVPGLLVIQIQIQAVCYKSATISITYNMNDGRDFLFFFC